MKRLTVVVLSLIAFSLKSQVNPLAPTVNANVNVTTEEKLSREQQRNEDAKASAAVGQANAAKLNAAASMVTAKAAAAEAMAPSAKELLIDWQTSPNEYTHIALVQADEIHTIAYNYNKIEKLLAGGYLSVVNPTKKTIKFIKDPFYLKSEKNEDWLYLYYSNEVIGVDHINILTLRDYKGKIIYKAKCINQTDTEIFSPLTDF